MQKIIPLLIISLTFLYAQSEDELAQQLFEKAFTQKKSDNVKEFYLPLRVNKILQNEVFVQIDTNEHISINEKTLEYILSLIKKEHQKKFIYTKGQTFYPLSILNQLGIKATYNNKEILIDIYLPPQLKSTNLIHLRSNNKKDINGSIVATPYSGGINLYLNRQYSKSFASSLVEGKLFGSSDLFINMHEYVVEGRLDYIEGNEDELVRDRFKVIKDDTENSIRYSVGDIILPTHTRMSHLDSMGISFEKIFNINSDNFSKNASRINAYEFFLKNRSTVEIFINNRYTQRLTLNSGTHNLYDLRLPTGLNQIKLKVIEEGGKVEYIEFDDFAYSEILEKGMIKYGAGLGITSEKNLIDYQWIYYNDQPITSMYIDYGITNWLTIETGLQANKDNHSEAFEFLIGTPIGLLNPYIVLSDINQTKGYKTGFDYRTDIQEININLGYEKINNNYTTLNAHGYSPVPSTLYRANIFKTLGSRSSLGITASYYIQDEMSEKAIGFDFSKSFFSNWDLRINYNRVQRETKNVEDEVYLTLTYNWDHSQASYINYAKEQRHQLDINYENEGIYGLSGELFYENSQHSDRYNVRTRMNDEKFIFDSSYSLNDNSLEQYQSLDMQLATGLVFAGDKATVTSPITSSFVIIDNDDRLKTPVGIEGYQESDAFIYDNFALQLGDYTQRTLTVDESHLDFGVNLKNLEETFITKYKSGSILNVETESLLSIKGVFLNKETHQPITYKAFKVFNTFSGTKSVGFTNENGEFTISGVEEGKYNISFMHELGYKDIATYNFEIKKSDLNKSLIDFHNIYLKIPKKKEIKNYKQTPK